MGWKYSQRTYSVCQEDFDTAILVVGTSWSMTLPQIGHEERSYLVMLLRCRYDQLDHLMQAESQLDVSIASHFWTRLRENCLPGISFVIVLALSSVVSPGQRPTRAVIIVILLI